MVFLLTRCCSIFGSEKNKPLVRSANQMVVRMMKWRPLHSKKFEAKLTVQRLEGLCVSAGGRKGLAVEVEAFARLAVEIKWKGSAGNNGGLSYLRRSVRRNCTREESLREDDGVVDWSEEFGSVCSFSGYREGLFRPWEVTFTVFSSLNQGSKNRTPVVATASLNLSEFASANEEKEHEISIPLSVPGGSIECGLSLCLSLSFLEIRSTLEPSDIVHRLVGSVTQPSQTADALSAEKAEVSAIKAGLRKVKILTRYASPQRTKKACLKLECSDGKICVRSEDAKCNYPIDTDSLDDMHEAESEEGKEDSSVRKSFSYESLPYANFVGGLFYGCNSDNEDWIYYSNCNCRSDAGYSEDSDASVLDQYLRQNSKRSILPWKKRKLNFRSPKAKGEPLLKKYYGEEGGDDIDFDRRQLSSSDESTFGLISHWYRAEEDSAANRSSVSEFGDDNFSVGTWEKKEVISRDSHKKLETQVFLASIDQRSERAAGESACTALVAVIADWFQCNRNQMPIKSQLDNLIREGSLEWRNLCENVVYQERFPDKHFDLETVLQAKLRPLCVVPEKSFVGFFHPEGLEEDGLEFLHGAMSFDNIWDEISRFASDNPNNDDDPLVYIVSWNDHFFVLKVEQEAYYIIDTLGERLYEGCNQAFVLKFDQDTEIRHVPEEFQPSDEQPAIDKALSPSTTPEESCSEGAEISVSNGTGNLEEEELVVCRGKESCKEYIKNFLAAIPIRELQGDLKKGLMTSSTPVHHRLQIEFHYTRCLQSVAQFSPTEATADDALLSVV